MSLQVTLVADTLAALRGLAAAFADPAPSLKDTLMPLFDDLSAKLDDLKAAAVSEHDQVKAALDALQASVAQGLSPDQVTVINTKFDEAKAAISGVFEPAPAPAPAA